MAVLQLDKELYVPHSFFEILDTVFPIPAPQVFQHIAGVIAAHAFRSQHGQLRPQAVDLAAVL
jgi:hypothetical protein